MAVGALLSNAVGFKAHGPKMGLRSTPIHHGTEAATQTWKAGAPLKAVAGLLTVGTADMTTGIVGVAVHAASGTTGADVEYYPALPSILFEGTLEDQTNVSHVLVAADKYVAYAIQVDSNGIWYLDENDTTNGIGMIVSFKEAAGTTRARVYFVFENASTIYV